MKISPATTLAELSDYLRRRRLKKVVLLKNRFGYWVTLYRVAEHGHVLASEGHGKTLREAIQDAVDELVDKLDRQVVRHKTKLTNHHHEAPKRMM